MKNTKILACASLLVVASLPVNSAKATSNPSSADAGRIEKAIKQAFPQAVKSAPVSVKGNAPFTAPAGAEKIKFVLKTIEIEGASVFSSDDLKASYADKVGQTISLADVYSIAANITAKYRNEGYILTQIIVPPQTIDGGTVRLQAVEGKLDQIKVDGPGAQGSNANIINK